MRARDRRNRAIARSLGARPAARAASELVFETGKSWIKF